MRSRCQPLTFGSKLTEALLISVADLSNPRDESFMTSATSLSQATITDSSPDLTDILVRLKALENAPAPVIASTSGE